MVSVAYHPDRSSNNLLISLLYRLKPQPSPSHFTRTNNVRKESTRQTTTKNKPCAACLETIKARNPKAKYKFPYPDSSDVQLAPHSCCSLSQQSDLVVRITVESPPISRYVWPLVKRFLEPLLKHLGLSTMNGFCVVVATGCCVLGYSDVRGILWGFRGSVCSATTLGRRLPQRETIY